MRTIPALVLLALCLGLASPTTAADWQEYRPAGGGYKLEFPGKPTVTQGNSATRAGPVRMSVALLDAMPDGFYIASSTTFTRGSLRDDPQRTLAGARDGAIRNVGGQLVSEQPTTVDGSPALRFVAEMPKSGHLCHALLVVNGARLYQVLMVVPTGNEHSTSSGGQSPEAERFLGSFALVR